LWPRLALAGGSIERRKPTNYTINLQDDAVEVDGATWSNRRPLFAAPTPGLLAITSSPTGPNRYCNVGKP
jgi:hypothetical protein